MNHVDRDQDATLVQQYDDLAMLPLLKIVKGFLNLGQVVGPILPTLELPSILIRLFGLVASTHETIEGLSKLNYLCFVSSMWRM
jgi:hypothetical protein